MMIEIPMWLLMIWFGAPVVLIGIAYLLVIGFKPPWEIDESRQIHDIYSSDNNKIDDQGGPYSVKIK